MSILERFKKFQHQFWAKAGTELKVAPWTREEADEVAANIQCDTRNNSLYGMQMYFTPYAKAIRLRIIEQNVYSPEIELERECEPSVFQRMDIQKSMRLKLATKIAADVSHVRVIIECDPWANVKRWLRLTKRFPIKTQSFVIEGTILYPHLKVNFPAARHHVKLKLVE